MKVAVFGGTGFLGYDFIRTALKQGNVEPVVYSSSPKSLTNVARHDIDIRLYSSTDPQAIKLDDDVECIVNYAHPFESRGSISGKKQIRGFIEFVKAARQSNAQLRLIHMSSMSVFEPFDKPIHYDESMALHPPNDDSYAQEKVLAETEFLKLPDADLWQLHLRPTVVYGPFCGVWTDRIFEAFTSGDVGYYDMSGKIQPIYGEDVSRFVYDRLLNFQPGIYNLPGSEEHTWYDFASQFLAIVNKGNLVQIEGASDQSAEQKESMLRFYITNSRELLQAIRREPSFDRMARRISQHLPKQVFNWIRAFLLGKDGVVKKPTVAADTSAQPSLIPFGRKFFSEDRLVSDVKLQSAFPQFQSMRLSETKDILTDYYHYRFTDNI